MGEEEAQFLFRIVPLRQDGGIFLPPLPEGEGGPGGGGAEQPDLPWEVHVEEGLLPEGQDLGVLLGIRPGEQLTPEAPVSHDPSAEDQQEARQPHPPQGRQQFFPQGDHKARHPAEVQEAVHARPNERGHQPEGGAEPGGEAPPQQGQRRQQKEEVEAQVGGGFQQHPHGQVGPLFRPVKEHRQQGKGRDHKGEGVGIAVDHGVLPVIPPGLPGLHPAAAGIADAHRPGEGQSHGQPEENGDAHPSSPSSSIRRSSSISSRETPPSQRETAKLRRDPP